MIGLGTSTKTWEGVFNLKKKQQENTKKAVSTLKPESIWQTKYAPHPVYWETYNPKYYYEKYDSLGALMK